MTGVRRDPLGWAQEKLKEQQQARTDEACGYRRECIEGIREAGAAMTRAPAAHGTAAPAPKQPDVAAGMMGGMGGS